MIALAPASGLDRRFADAAQRLIARIPAPAALLAKEREALNEVQFGAATNRSVRSSMNHFAYAVDEWLASGRPLDIEAMSYWLCDTPCFPLETTWPWLEAELVLTGLVAPNRRPLKFKHHGT